MDARVYHMLPGRRSHQFCRATRKRKGPRGLYRSRPRLLRNSARSLMENGAEIIRRLALVIREKLPDASSALRELAGGPLMNIIRELLTGGCVKCTTRVPPPDLGRESSRTGRVSPQDPRNSPQVAATAVHCWSAPRPFCTSVGPAGVF